MDVIYSIGAATAADVRARLPEPPSYSAVRAMLRILEGKGHLRHSQDGPRYVYAPVVARATARQSALRQVVRTFFDGSAAKAAAALLGDARLSSEEVTEIERLIEKARREGR